MNCSTPGLPVHHQLPEFTQTHVHQVGDAIQPSHPLSSPSLPAPKSLPASESFPMSQLFAWGGQSTGASALASFLPKKSQGWSPSEWTGWISLLLSAYFHSLSIEVCPHLQRDIIHLHPATTEYLNNPAMAHTIFAGKMSMVSNFPHEHRYNIPLMTSSSEEIHLTHWFRIQKYPQRNSQRGMSCCPSIWLNSWESFGQRATLPQYCQETTIDHLSSHIIKISQTSFRHFGVPKAIYSFFSNFT